MSFTLEVYLTTLFSDIFCFSDFSLGQDMTERDGTDKQTNGPTDIGTDRRFSENVILDAFKIIKYFVCYSDCCVRMHQFWIAKSTKHETLKP